jgi:hypothetical protein
MVVTKNKEKKSTSIEVGSDSEESEDSEESTVKESKKKVKSKNKLQAQCKYYCTCTSSFSVFFIFCNSVYSDIIFPFFCILCFPFLGYGSNEDKIKELYV